MKTTTFQKRIAYLVAGGVGLLVAVIYIALAVRLPFGQLDRPGAAAFPVLVGILLLLASLATLREGWSMDRDTLVELPAGADRSRLLTLVVLLLGYYFVLPWLGQVVTGAIFAALLMRILSDISWTRIVISSLIISVVLSLVFERLLSVPLPRGVLGL